MKRIKDLREYIEELRRLGDIQEVNREVDPHLEMAAVARRSYDLQSPAPLFSRSPLRSRSRDRPLA